MDLIRTCVGLIITVTMLPLCALAFSYTAGIDFSYREINDEIALFQLRECMLISYDLDYQPDRLSFRYEGSDFTLSLVNRKLILQPGTQIYLDEIDGLYFERRGDVIYAVYERDGKTYERIVAGATGLYLDDFSDCTVPDHGDRRGEE